MKNVSTILFFFVSSLFILKVAATGGGCAVTTPTPTTTNPPTTTTTQPGPITTKSPSTACKNVEGFTLTSECLGRCGCQAAPTNPRVANALAAICAAQACIQSSGGNLIAAIINILFPPPPSKCENIPDNLPEPDSACLAKLPGLDYAALKALPAGVNKDNTINSIKLICQAFQCLEDEGKVVPTISPSNCQCSLLGLPSLGLGDILRVVCSLVDCLLDSLGIALAD